MASSCKKGYYFCNTSQECKRIPRGHKVQSDGELVREYVSDWRSDLQELAPSQQGLSTLKDRKKIQQGFDNLPTFVPKTETNTETKDGKTTKSSTSVTMVNREDETRKAISRFPKIDGVKLETDSDGNVPNAGKFAADISSKKLNTPFFSKVGNTVLGKNKFDQVKKYTSDGRLERDVNSANPGSWQFRANIAADEVNQGTQDARTKANKNKGRFRVGVTNNEELQGGVSVEPYTKDTKFLEVETVDIIKPKALNASDWRSELDILGEGNRTKGFLGSGNKKDHSKGPNEAAPVDYRYLVKNDKKKETVSASYEADLENMIIEILEEDINDLHNEGFSYEEIAEFYDVKEELLNEGLVSGAIAGAKIIAKFAPKIAKFAAKRGIKDRKILTKFVRNPKNLQRANTDIQKIIDAPKNTYKLGKSFRQFADKGYKALKGGAQKLIEPLKKKGEGDIAKWKKTQEVIKRANSLARTKAEKAGKIVDIAPKTTNLPSAKKSLPLPKKVTKGMTPAEIRHQGMNALAKLQGNTEKTRKAAELTKRMARAVEVSKKPGTYSRKVDDALKIKTPSTSSSPIVKSKGSVLSKVTDKGSALVAKVKNFFSKKGTKQLTGTKTPQKLSGTNVKGSLPSGSSKGTKQPYSAKREYTKRWMAYNKAAGATVKSDKMAKNAAITGGAAGLLGVVAGSQSTKDSKIAKSKTKEFKLPGEFPGTKAEFDAKYGIGGKEKTSSSQPSQSPKLVSPPKENKTIKDTEKKTVDPKKNEVVTKTTTKKTSTTPKGKTKWVGANTTWVDRHGNVIAPKAKENKKYKYGRTGSHLTPLEQEQAN